ncbi:hypothetical protein GUITHDRAFT_136986 [Guillardia theta CCMP2712]|uniref:KOW domain-containing protein n=2 Tax=Guillardia theta TaxID=55529 RepID=L1JHQ2_GUITC|nr:hypothetical protein GUITHDRAFT_136986 [Guillardia theta CCMP2712]EKX48026.1 hypothetical protein GUITHDRAFT_136986 [Guillardia theta CCMP2712]|eukprot:XP_005835006.1 hypothetical protein GUITHDRAFT_136986 [Guillardia theta CCMP2712]
MQHTTASIHTLLLLLLLFPFHAEQSPCLVSGMCQHSPCSGWRLRCEIQGPKEGAEAAEVESHPLLCFMTGLKVRGIPKSCSPSMAPRSRMRSCQEGVRSLSASGSQRRDGGMNELERAREALAGIIAKRRDNQAAYSFNQDAAAPSSLTRPESLGDRMAKSMSKEFKWLSEANAVENFRWTEEDESEDKAMHDVPETRDQDNRPEVQEWKPMNGQQVEEFEDVRVKDEMPPSGSDDAARAMLEADGDIAEEGEEGNRLETGMFELKYDQGSVWIPGDDPLTRTKGYLLNRVFPGLKLDAHQMLDDYLSRLNGESSQAQLLHEFRREIGMDTPDQEEEEEEADPFAKAFKGMELSVPLLSEKGLKQSRGKESELVEEHKAMKLGEASPEMSLQTTKEQVKQPGEAVKSKGADVKLDVPRAVEVHEDVKATDVVVLSASLLAGREGEAQELETSYDMRVVFANEKTIGIRTTWSDGFEVVEEVDLRTGKIFEIQEEELGDEGVETRGLEVTDGVERKEHQQQAPKPSAGEEGGAVREEEEVKEGMLVRVTSKSSRYRNLVGLIVAVVGNGKRVRVQFAGLRQTALLQKTSIQAVKLEED